MKDAMNRKIWVVTEAKTGETSILFGEPWKDNLINVAESYKSDVLGQPPPGEFWEFDLVRSGEPPSRKEIDEQRLWELYAAYCIRGSEQYNNSAFFEHARADVARFNEFFAKMKGGA